MTSLTLLTHYTLSPLYCTEEVPTLVLPNREEYCARHGYQHLVHAGPYRDLGHLYYAIQRLHLLRDLLFEGDATAAPDLVWVLNAPALVTNMTIPVTQYLDEDHDFFICRERGHLNAASFVIRRTDWARQWLDLLIKEAPHAGDWFENRVMIDRQPDSPWKERIKVLPHPSINSYPYHVYPIDTSTPGNWEPGHLVLTMPGTNLTTRLSLIKGTLPKVIR